MRSKPRKNYPLPARISQTTQLEAPDLTATVPLVPPAKTTLTGLAFADEGLSSVANPEVDKKTKKKAALPHLDTETGGACLPPPPANGIVVCATSGRYPPIKKLRKKKTWAPFEDVAGRLAKAVAVRVPSHFLYKSDILIFVFVLFRDRFDGGEE